MIYIVQNSGSNFFINELLAKISVCFKSLGIENTLVMDKFPNSVSARYIFVPHEWVNGQGERRLPNRKILSRSIAFITENPGSPWYEDCKRFSRHFNRFLFINKSSLDLFPTSLKKKYFFQIFNEPNNLNLNYLEWSQRPYTFAFIGGSDNDRKVKIAALSPIFAAENSYISLTPTKISPIPSTGQVSTSEFNSILENTKILINLHRENTNSIEWQRLLMANNLGTIVFSEPCSENESKLLPWLLREFYSPLSLTEQVVSMRHLFEFAKQAKEVSCDLKYLNSTQELNFFLRSKLNARYRFIPLAFRNPKFFLETKLKHLKIRAFQKIYSFRWYFPEYTQIFHTFDRITGSQKSMTLENIRLRRMIESLTNSSNHLPGDHEILVDNLTDHNAIMTICVTVYNEGDLLIECLESLKRLELSVPFDIVVCSDAGGDTTLQVAERELKSSTLSYKIIKRHKNGGVGASRNTVLRESRGKFALMLDGDNSLFPKGAQFLLTAIESSVEATFAYGLLSVKQQSSYVDIMNYLPWDKTLFSEVGNYIDALTIINREKVLKIGGYSESLSLYGWEDFDLWARIAHLGGFGVQIKNFVATYLRRGNSMIATTNVDVRSALAEIRDRSNSIW